MEPNKDLIGKKPLLSNLLSEVRSDKPNLGQIGETLLDISEILVDGIGSKHDVELLREDWRRRTRGGSDVTAELYGPTRTFQNDIQEISNLRRTHGTVIFYVTGGGGTIRLGISVDENGKPKAWLSDDGSIRKVRERFNKLL